MNKLVSAVKRASRSMASSLPLILLITFLLSVLKVVVPASAYSYVFRRNFFDILIGDVLGSVSAGNPVTSYIIGGELLKQNISLFAVTAFIVAWVTVGIVQFPAESKLLGKKFAIYRNISSFILAIFVSLLTVLLVNLV